MPVIDSQSAGAPDSRLTELYDTPPPVYAPPNAPSTVPEREFLEAFLPIIALGFAAVVPSLLLAVIVLILTLRALVACTTFVNHVS